MKDRISIAAIGGGPAALFLLQALTKQPAIHFELTIFEKGDRLGAGMPYSNAGARTEHLANVSSNELPPLPQSVEEWLGANEHHTSLHENFQAHFSDYRVLPRLVLGDYLSDQFTLLINIANANGNYVEVKFNSLVVDLIDDKKTKHVTVQTEAGMDQTFDHVVICTGHQWPKIHEGSISGYFDSPYPPSKLSCIDDPHPVAIRGASLTAFDAIRTLSRRFGIFATDANGHVNYTLREGNENFRMVMHTRNGFLPAVRVHLEDPHFSHDGMLSQEEIRKHIQANDGFLALDYIFEEDFKQRFRHKDDEFFERIKTWNLETFVEEMLKLRETLDPFTLLRAEYAEAEKSIRRHQSVYWKEMLGALSFALNYPAKYFSAEDTERLHKYLLPLISVVIAFVPQPTARELLALYDAGVLQMIMVGEDSEVIPKKDGGICYRYIAPDGVVHNEYYKTFIDATGQKRFAYEDFPFKTLLNKKTVTPATVRYRNSDTDERMKLSGVAINDFFQVTDEFGAANPRIYVMAVPLIGGFNPDYSGLDFCEAAAGSVVRGMQAFMQGE